jgi:hypothetical protein
MLTPATIRRASDIETKWTMMFWESIENWRHRMAGHLWLSLCIDLPADWAVGLLMSIWMCLSFCEFCCGWECVWIMMLERYQDREN